MPPHWYENVYHNNVINCGITISSDSDLSFHTSKYETDSDSSIDLSGEDDDDMDAHQIMVTTTSYNANTDYLTLLTSDNMQ